MLKISILFLLAVALTKATSLNQCSRAIKWLDGKENVVLPKWSVIPSRFIGERPGRRKWTGGIVKYELHSSLNETERETIQQAFREFHDKTCVKFSERLDDDNYIVIKAVNPKTDIFPCPMAQKCMHHKRQVVNLGPTCRDKGSVIHALGDVLCLEHDKSSGKQYNYPDYLTLKDVEIINAAYNCQGCQRHRWKVIQNLTEIDKKAMKSFGMVDAEKKSKIFVCRGLVDGGWLLGSFRYEEKTCILNRVGLDGLNNVNNLTENAEVLLFGDDGSMTSCFGERSETIRYQYELINSCLVTGEQMVDMGVAAVETGDRTFRSQGYIGFSTVLTMNNDISGSEWDRMDVIGTVWNDRELGKKAYFGGGYNGKSGVFDNFKVLVCKTKRMKN